MTGPNNDVSTGRSRSKVMIGVPTSLPVRPSATSVSARRTSSQESSSAAAASLGGNPAASSDGVTRSPASSPFQSRTDAPWSCIRTPNSV